jgi:hypothetical protein
MKKALLAAALLLAANSASAAIPLFNATCPGGLEIHADEGGPVYINGNEAELAVMSDTYYEATYDGTVVSIMINADGSLNLSYTASGGVNGICEVVG